MASLLSISEVNALDGDQFEWVFGNVIELCTDAATKVKSKRPFKNVGDLCDEFHKYLDHLKEEEKLVILKLHPDLAGRLAARGELTRESTGEQQSAGLHELTSDQKSDMDCSNERSGRTILQQTGVQNRPGIRYKAKYGFPFIICARENKIKSIIEGLHRRYNNTREQEIDIGINEVKKICKLRILDIVKD